MQKLNVDRQTIIFFALIIFLAAELFILLPWGVKRAADLGKKAAKIHRQLKSITRDWPNKAQYSNSKAQLAQELKKLRSKFILPQQESKLLSFISASSKDFGVEIRSLSPARLEDFASTKFGNFKYLPITIKANSGFHNLVKFLEFLKNSQYFFEIKKIDISEDSSLMQSGQAPLNSVEMIICGAVEEK